MSDLRKLKDKAQEAFARGRFARAAELYEEYLGAEGKDHQVRIRMGDALLRAGEEKKAILAYRAAAEGYARDGFLPRAIAAAKLVLEVDPAHQGVQQILAELYARKSRPTPAPRVATPPAPREEPPAPPAETESAPVIEIEVEPKRPELSLEGARGVDLSEELPAELRGSPPRREGFTELELEGDSILHALEKAASAARLDGPPAAAEEAQPAPEELAPEQRPPGELPRIPLFSDLSPEAFVELFERCPLRRFSQGGRVLEQGTTGSSFFVICSGRVRVFRPEQGRERTLAVLEEGAFFGEMALLSGAPRSASVEATAPATELLEITAPVLAELSSRYPQVAAALKKFCRQRMLANLMSSSPLFGPFSQSDRRELVRRFRAREVGAGDSPIREGQPSDGLYVVLSGEVEVKKGGQRLAILRQGEIFGEMSLLQKTPATATVAALKRTSLLRLPRPDFDELIMSHPQVLMLVAELTDQRRQETERSAGEGAAGDEPLLLV